MVEHHPEMAPGFPGSQIREQKSEPIAALSAFERELVHAIHTRHIFPVFRAIADERRQLKGMEILSRWNRNGSVLLADEFLPQIGSEYALAGAHRFCASGGGTEYQPAFWRMLFRREYSRRRRQ